MLDVPKWPPALDLGDDGKVVSRRRRRSRPFQRPGVPRIVPRRTSPEVRSHQVEHEAQHRQNLEKGPDRDDHVPGLPTVSWLVGVDPAWHPEEPGNVHEIEAKVKADQKQPEMPLA